MNNLERDAAIDDLIERVTALEQKFSDDSSAENQAPETQQDAAAGDPSKGQDTDDNGEHE